MIAKCFTESKACSWQIELKDEGRLGDLTQCVDVE